MAYPKHDPTPPASRRAPTCPRSSARVLDTGPADKTFEASRRGPRRPGVDGANEYVFYDGPPFANGLPHYGHLLTGYVKDVVPRYQTMRGRRVERRFGWDCHGLPAEVEAEKQLGITTKARDPRPGRGQVQRGLPHLGAALHPGLGALRHPAGPLGRLRQRLQDPRPGLHGERHVGVQDPVRQGPGLRGLPGAGVLLAVRDAAVQHRDPDGRRLPRPAGPGAHRVVRPGPSRRADESIAVWTTTPWTLPSNLALAVGPDIEYAVLETRRRAGYVLGAARLAATPRSWRAATQVGTVHGRDLVGRRYTPLFDFLVEQAGPNAFQVLGGGLRHHRGRHRRRAPGARPSARTTRTPATRPASRPWSPSTTTPGSPRWCRRTRACRSSRPTSRSSRDLKERGVVLRHDTYTHSYPHCWRCDTPLVYKAVSSWFVAVTQFRDRMVELNQQITWVPGARQGRLVRQVAGQRPGLVDQPQPVLGLADPGVEVRRPGLPAGRRLRLAGRAGARLRRRR